MLPNPPPQRSASYASSCASHADAGAVLVKTAMNVLLSEMQYTSSARLLGEGQAANSSEQVVRNRSRQQALSEELAKVRRTRVWR